MRTRTPLLWIGLSCLLLAGCVHTSEDGGTKTFTYELWLPLTVFLGGAVGFAAGLLGRKKLGRFGWALMIGGPIAALLFAPSLLFEKSTVNADGFRVQTGIWGLTSIHELRFDDISSIRITSETRRGRRGSSTSYYLVCQRKSGDSAKVPANNDVCEAAVLAIVEQAAASGIPIANET